MATDPNTGTTTGNLPLPSQPPFPGFPAPPPTGATPTPAAAPNAVPGPPPNPESLVDMPHVIPKTRGENIGQFVGMMLPGVGTPIERAVQEHYQNRLAQIRLYHQGATALATSLAMGAPQDPNDPNSPPTGINPQTGQPMTEDDRKAYRAAHDALLGHYKEAAGVDQKTKGMLKGVDALSNHFLSRGHPMGNPAGAAGAAGGAAPAANGAAAGPSGAGAAPNGVPAGPPPLPVSPEMFEASNKTAMGIRGRSLELQAELTANRERLKAAGIDENSREGKYLLASGKLPPVFHTTLHNYTKPDGSVGIALEDGTGGMIDRDTQEPVDPGSVITPMGALTPKKIVYMKNGKPAFGTQIGTKRIGDDGQELPPGTQVFESAMVPMVTSKTAGDTGLTDVTRKGPAGVPAPPPSPQAAAPATRGAGAAPNSGTKTAAPGGAGGAGAVKLDETGHIPANTPGYTKSVIEAANQLIDDRDVDKIPARVRELGASLARSTGWNQGKFTPKEQTLLRESTTFLQEAQNNPSLSVLDDTASKLKLGQIVAAADEQGYIGRGLSTIAASNMTPKEAEFIRMYNQLVGTISGLGQLVRSGRMTEASINRLKAELPNPTTTKDSEDGKERIQRLLKEVDVAMQKGSFEGTGGGAAPARPAGVPPDAHWDETRRRWVK